MSTTAFISNPAGIASRQTFIQAVRQQCELKQNRLAVFSSSSCHRSGFSQVAMSRTRDPQPISPLVSLAATSSTWLLLIIQQHPSLAAELSTPKPTFEPRGITPQDTLVFIIGTIPFGIATWQFWTRIAKGQRFGTGKDSVVIDTGRMDWKKQDEESKADEGEIKTENKTKGAARTLSKDAIQVAYILMMAALFAYGLVFASGYDVLTRK